MLWANSKKLLLIVSFSLVLFSLISGVISYTYSTSKIPVTLRVVSKEAGVPIRLILIVSFSTGIAVTVCLIAYRKYKLKRR